MQPELIVKSFVKLNVRKSMVPEYKENLDLLRLVKIRKMISTLMKENKFWGIRLLIYKIYSV